VLRKAERMVAVKNAGPAKKKSRKPTSSSGARPKVASRVKSAKATSPGNSGTAARAPVVVDPAFRPVADAFAGAPGVGLGRMFSSNSVLNARGKIFAMFVKGRFVAKLPRQRVAELVAAGVGTHFDPGHGRLMKEWVAVADADGSWIELAREAHAFVTSKGR
jgi:hypothetical protein